MSARQMIERLELPQAWRQRGAQLHSGALAWWVRHPRHERLLLAACAALVLVALLWLVVMRPAWHTLSEAREQLPLLRSELAQVQAVVREAQALQQGRSARIDASQVPAALAASLRRANLESSVQVTADGPRRWSAVVHDAPAARLMDWLAGLPFLVQTRTESVVLERTNIDGRDRPGSVTGRIVLAQDAEAAR